MTTPKNNLDFSQGKIYMIWCNVTGKFYIGSTTTTLKKRKQNHKKDYQKWKRGTGRKVTSYDIIENNDYAIILLEDFPCNNLKDLFDREQYWIDYHTGCINTNKASITIEEKKEYHQKYYQDDKEKFDKQSMDRYYANIDENRAKLRDYYYTNKNNVLKKITCECGCVVAKGSLLRHATSKKHLAQTTNIISLI